MATKPLSELLWRPILLYICNIMSNYHIYCSLHSACLIIHIIFANTFTYTMLYIIYIYIYTIHILYIY